MCRDARIITERKPRFPSQFRLGAGATANRATFCLNDFEDNAAVATVIRTVMPEFGACGEGFAINDPEVDYMHRAYAAPRPVRTAPSIYPQTHWSEPQT